MRVVISIWGAGCCLACASTQSGLKARFGREQACPVDQVGVVEEGGTVYRATGCGKDTEYVCGSVAGMGDDSSRSCVVRGANRREATGSPPSKTEYRPELEGPR